MAECRFKLPFAVKDDFRDLNVYATIHTPTCDSSFKELAFNFHSHRS